MLTLIVWVTLLALCRSRQGEKIAVVDIGSSCKQLQKPTHGQYRCRTTEGGEVCQLTCDVGYTVPNNEYKHDGKHIPLEKRGIYKCTSTPGGVIWLPLQLFSCIPLIQPAYFVYYYALTLTPDRTPCLNDSQRQYHLSSFKVNAPTGLSKESCSRELHVNCHWKFDMRCKRGAWAMDAWFRIPFSMDMLDTFDQWNSVFDRYTANESVNVFVLNGQQAKTIMKRNGFYIECPMATRMERDYTCRGCSKGYYMSQSLLECLPCPAYRYQDQDYSHTCKPCPSDSDKHTTGLTKLIDCFHFSYWEEGTSLGRIFAGMFCIVAFSTLMLFYRSRIRNEPDGEHPEVYKEVQLQIAGGGRLLRLMRLLHPMSKFPSQFDYMSIAAQLPSDTRSKFTATTLKEFDKSLRATEITDSPSSWSNESDIEN